MVGKETNKTLESCFFFFFFLIRLLRVMRSLLEVVLGHLGRCSCAEGVVLGVFPPRGKLGEDLA